MLDFRIATFLLLCETRSYTRTARLLGITQPSVTQHIKYLQKHFGCQLFRYEGKVLILTQEGEYLRRQAQAMAQTCERVRAELLRMGDHAAPLRIGIPAEFGEAFGAALFTALAQEGGFPGLSLTSGTSGGLVRQLANGTLDCVLTDPVCADGTLAATAVGKLRFGCFCATLAEISLSQLLRTRLLVPEEDSADWLVMRSLLQENGLSPEDFTSIWRIGSPAAMRQMTAAGQGICFAYQTAMAPSATLAADSQLCTQREIVCLSRADAGSAVRTLIQMIQDVWQPCVDAAEERKQD